MIKKKHCFVSQSLKINRVSVIAYLLIVKDVNNFIQNIIVSYLKEPTLYYISLVQNLDISFSHLICFFLLQKCSIIYKTEVNSVLLAK